jgi:hypothetical protein
MGGEVLERGLKAAQSQQVMQVEQWFALTSAIVVNQPLRWAHVDR